MYVLFDKKPRNQRYPSQPYGRQCIHPRLPLGARRLADGARPAQSTTRNHAGMFFDRTSLYELKTN
jgi:hypothetical protein